MNTPVRACAPTLPQLTFFFPSLQVKGDMVLFRALWGPLPALAALLVCWLPPAGAQPLPSTVGSDLKHASKVYSADGKLILDLIVKEWYSVSRLPSTFHVKPGRVHVKCSVSGAAPLATTKRRCCLSEPQPSSSDPIVAYYWKGEAQVPGPTLILRPGDDVVIRITDALPPGYRVRRWIRGHRVCIGCCVTREWSHPLCV